MTVGASRAELTINRQPALAPSPQPRPAPTARALPPKPVARGGHNWTPIGGQIWAPIDTRTSRSSKLPRNFLIPHSCFQLALLLNSTPRHKHARGDGLFY